MSKSRLGKGLDALLSSTVQSPQNSPSRGPATDRAKQINAGATGPLEVAVGDITPSPYQPRREFDEDALAELAASIAAQGVLQPLVVRTKAQGGFELIAGERRWRAARQAGLQQVPVVLKQVSDQEASTIALVENIQREDLGAMEQAAGLERLRSEFDLTQQELAEVELMSKQDVPTKHDCNFHALVRLVAASKATNAIQEELENLERHLERLKQMTPFADNCTAAAAAEAEAAAAAAEDQVEQQLLI